VKADYVITEGGEQYQLDNVGTPEQEGVDAVWVTEQKNWEKRVGVEAARKFAQAVEAYRAERGLKRLVAWLYGRAGFTAAARASLEKEGILYSDQEQLLDLAEELGLVGV
jgi:restriction endonuclease Mrr